MAADHFRCKNHDTCDRPKYMEHNLTCAQGERESIMKFSPQQIESPPPKPPRRRYSDQLSIPSLGTCASKKHHEETQRSDPKLKRYSPKPAYLSLPANLTSNVLTECDDSSNLLSNPFCISDQFKHSKENEFYMKYFLENLNVSDSIKKTQSSNQFCYKEKLESVSQGVDKDHMFSKYQYDDDAPCTVDKFSKNCKSNNKTFVTNKCNHNLKPVHKDCHRRHHSDSAISHFNLQKDNALKFDWEHCHDYTSHSSKRISEYCDSDGSCSCCKKTYFIMQEIRILKEINEKLWQHLCSLQSSVENMRKKAYDECTDVSLSGLLSSIYYAQKAKDCAMEERIKIVLEERDGALHELDDLIHVLTKHDDYSEEEKEMDKNMKELLGDIRCTSNPSRLLKYQRMVLAQIHNLKSSKQDCLSHELKQAVIERDNALEKVSKLEADVKDLTICYDLWHSDNKRWESSLFDILNQVMHQRDTILSKIDNGFDIGNVIYRLPMANRLDSIDHQNVSSFEPLSKAFESLKNYEPLHLNDYKHQHSISTSDEVRQLKEEILLLNKALESERKKREQSEGKCVRLEKLVHILRKKLNGQNVGVPV